MSGQEFSEIAPVEGEAMIEGEPLVEETIHEPITGKEPAAGEGPSTGEAAPNEPAHGRRNILAAIGPVGIIATVALILAAVIVFAVITRVQATANMVRSRMTAGQTALVEGDLDRALYEYTSALQINPRMPGAHKALGQIALANGRADEAVKHFETELEINPSDRQSHIALGCLYTLGIIPPDDPHSMRGYMLRKFTDIAPAAWSEKLAFTPPAGVDPLTSAIYHFQYAAEKSPSDPTPGIGLALAHLATYDLSTARYKLNRLAAKLSTDNTIDEGELGIVQGILGDINQEEQYISLQAQAPLAPATGAGPAPVQESAPPVEQGLSVQQPDLSGGLAALPPMPGIGNQAQSGNSEFGSRYQANAETSNQNNLGLRLSPEDMIPQPTVKPISQDVHVQDTDEWVHTVRLANIYEEGNVGFREGETVVMPNTNAEVKVIEKTDNRIVLEEQGNRFVWVRGDVGWVLQEQQTSSGQTIPQLNITATNPEASGDSEQGSTGDQSALGPEVPSQR